MIEQTLAHYRVQQKLGAGGMGEVYRATDTRLGRDVALKVLPPEATRDPAARARLLEEARNASTLNHPHICHVYEVNESAGTMYIAMELVEGQPLAARIPSGGLPIESVVRYGEQIADAVAHAHERHVIHRDLKSANVVITPEGRAKVLDFGLAQRIRKEELDVVTRSKVSLGEAGGIAGTLYALAPEVLQGEPASERSDVWALGVLLYEMASGTHPFSGRSGFELTSAILRETPAALPEEVPPALRAVIQRCLAREPGERYRTAAEVRAALEAIRSGTSVAVPPSLFPAARRVHSLVWISGALLIAVLLYLGWMNRDTSKSSSTPPVPAAAAGPRLSTGGEASKIPEANEYYERGWLIAMSRLDIPQMRQMHEHALKLDPKFAEARAELAFINVLLLISGQSNDSSLLYKAEEECRRALQDSPHNGRAHSVLAGVFLLQGRLDLVPGETQKALEANPNEMAALSWDIDVHQLRGEYAQATEIAQKVLTRSPLFFPARMSYGAMLLEQGDKAGGIRELEKVVEQAPQNLVGVCYFARILLLAGDAQRARNALEKVPAPARKSYLFRLSWATLLALEGKRAEALKTMDADVLKYADNVSFFTADVADFYAVLGEKEKSLDALDRAVRNGDERAEWFQRNPLLANIRKEPRFKQILDSIAYRRQQRAGTTKQ